MTQTPFLDLAAKRRTQYALGKTLPIAQDEVTRIIQTAVRVSPSAFNSQSSRVVILYGAQSDRFWSIVKEELRKIVPPANFEATEKRLAGFAAGAGTVLFYEDQDAVKALQEKFAIYAENFPIWSEQSSGMAQLAVWTALADVNIGASLQHYNPVADAAVAAEWNIPANWKLRAQMPFGANAAAPAEKTFIEDASRFRVFA